MKTLPLYFSAGMRSLADLFYPHLCAGCGTSLYSKEAVLCYRCLQHLPATNFHEHTGNLVEKIFWGRLELVAATSLCYFTKDTLIQQLLHQLKYKGNRAVGSLSGRMLGKSMLESGRFGGIELIIPMPLHPKKEKIRGFNQAQIIAMGIAEITGWPVVTNSIERTSFTETQTQKNRVERWDNLKEKFACADPTLLRGKHVLLIDDVITTGATLEACGTEILKVPGTRLSIATLAYAIK